MNFDTASFLRPSLTHAFIVYVFVSCLLFRRYIPPVLPDKFLLLLALVHVLVSLQILPKLTISGHSMAGAPAIWSMIIIMSGIAIMGDAFILPVLKIVSGIFDDLFGAGQKVGRVVASIFR